MCTYYLYVPHEQDTSGANRGPQRLVSTWKSQVTALAGTLNIHRDKREQVTLQKNEWEEPVAWTPMETSVDKNRHSEDKEWV